MIRLQQTADGWVVEVTGKEPRSVQFHVSSHRFEFIVDGENEVAVVRQEQDDLAEIDGEWFSPAAMADAVARVANLGGVRRLHAHAALHDERVQLVALHLLAAEAANLLV